jgi:superfamily II DNA or RNA helicase
MRNTILGIPLSEIDTNKYIRQLRGVVRWKQSNGRGTLEYATGVGKTFTAIIAIKKMLMQKKVEPIIIVPTTELKLQWERLLRSFSINGNVYCINTVALGNKEYQCDVLVLDELHLYASKEFRKVFTKIKYRFILGLTATIKRLDGNEVLLEKYCPVIDTITQEQAVKKGWISDFVQINVPVFLTRNEIKEQEKLNIEIQKYMRTFGSFDVMKSCMGKENADKFALRKRLESGAVIGMARKGMAKIRERKTFLDNTEHKVNATVELIEALNLKTIVFSQNTSFAEEVSKRVPSVLYHSNLKSVMVDEYREKTYVSENSAIRYSTKVNGHVEQIDNLFVVKWVKKVKYGAKRLRERAIQLFKEGKVKTICTAKALDQGFDDRTAELGIDASRTSNPATHIQKTGRICRNYTYPDGTVKRGFYVCLYIPDYIVQGSADEVRLRKAQKNSSVYYVNDVDECVSLIKSML